MAKRPIDKRAARMEKNNRNMNRASALLTICFLAEFYLLMLNNYFVRGTVDQVVASDNLLNVMKYVGFALAVGGAVMLWKRDQKSWFASVGGWTLAVGIFFAFSSILMHTIYPGGTTAMCILVPVIMILGIIFLLYQREFAVQAVALALSLTALVLLNRGHGSALWNTRVTVVAVLVLVLLAVALYLTARIRRNNGMIGSGEKTRRVFSPDADYRMIFGVLALCALVVVLATAVPTAAFYGIWLLAVVTFILAVFYTVKLL